MEERAKIPVTLPRLNPTVSYWQDPPDPEIADFLSADTIPETADMVIIGSGITGAAVAWNLFQNDARRDGDGEGKGKKERIVMLEARRACSGATGRNGGHTKAASYRSFHDNAKTLGTAQAVKIARLEYANIKAVHAFAREHRIQCDSWEGDTVDIIYDQAQFDAGVESINAMRETMPSPEDLETVSRYQFWSKEEARENWFVKGEEAVGAVSYAAGSLSAYKFVLGLLKLCLAAGLELYTNTPAHALSHLPDEGIWKVETSRGVLKAKKVILCTNGYTGYISSIFQGAIVPLRGQITAHRPGSKMPKEGLPGTYSFIYENGYEYMIPRPPGSKFAGDIVIGGGLVKAHDEGLEEFGTTDDTSVNKEISQYLTETTPRYFGANWGEDDQDGRVRREWTGIMGYSGDGFPFVGEVPNQEGLWVAASFQGHGMVLCWMCAKALTSMMIGKDEEVKAWFPDTFRVSEKRLRNQFKGRLHTKVEPDSPVVENEAKGK